ncbi:hypothetical protein KP509_34G062700 [Ceratopteris richardii]|uniref:Uncharacterized protein n=1 Tax=Ceratopteris richardii TaxID=49495 RepID=A0A8T2QLS9_CERRI|nr:hypothetical protein KP509_34G062700 [Ceratopteris richardii]
MLLFSTLEEAATAVGRNLTTADALWFRYTAVIPDSWLFYLNAVFLFVIFNTATLPSLLLNVLGQTTFPYLRRFKLQPSFTPLPVAFRIYMSVMKTFIFLLVRSYRCSFPLICWRNKPCHQSVLAYLDASTCLFVTTSTTYTDVTPVHANDNVHNRIHLRILDLGLHALSHFFQHGIRACEEVAMDSWFGQETLTRLH